MLPVEMCLCFHHFDSEMSLFADGTPQRKKSLWCLDPGAIRAGQGSCIQHQQQWLSQSGTEGRYGIITLGILLKLFLSFMYCLRLFLSLFFLFFCTQQNTVYTVQYSVQHNTKTIWPGNPDLSALFLFQEMKFWGQQSISIIYQRTRSWTYWSWWSRMMTRFKSSRRTTGARVLEILSRLPKVLRQ